MAGRLVVESAQTRLVVGRALSKTFRPSRLRAKVMAQCSLLPTSTPMKTSTSSISIPVPSLAQVGQGHPIGDRPRTHACGRPHTKWAVPLIGGG